MNAFTVLIVVITSPLVLWLLAEIATRLYLETPLQTGFYSSIQKSSVLEYQARYGVQVSNGLGWAHLGWVANPEDERYQIVKMTPEGEQLIGITQYGSFLLKEDSGKFRVDALPKEGRPYPIGQVEVQPQEGTTQVFVPRIAGPWQMLFKPEKYGNYLNDHSIYQDIQGNWRLVGITSQSNGDFNAEKYFSVGVSADFPPTVGMQEAEPIADFGELAWAPHVISHQGTYHIFWSPHNLHHMTSPDGITWENHEVALPTPQHKFFRDPMVLQVAPGQWLLYTTARGAYFSQIDVYQSFNLREWQYIRTALRSGRGSERNSPVSSMESPFVTRFLNHYYLSITYNNDSYFWPGILMLFKIWPDRASYNDTLVLHSDNPYDFGVYRGRDRSPSLLTRLEAHAAEIVHNPQEDSWYITTAGWPWVATLTAGEVAVAPLEWLPLLEK